MQDDQASDGFEDFFDLADSDPGYNSSSDDQVHDENQRALPIDLHFSPDPNLSNYYIGFLRRYSRGKTSKADAQGYWEWAKEHSVYPPEEIKSLDTLLRNVAKVLPQPKLTWKVLNITTGKHFSGTGWTLPFRRYGDRNIYEFVEVWARLTIRDVIRLHAALHADDCDFVEDGVIQFDKVSVTFTCDGIPHGKSSPDNLHVVALKIKGCRLVHIVQTRVARRKVPKDLSDFLDPFVDECLELGVKVDYFVADSPMRSFFKMLKGHAGRSSCEVCEATGVCINRKIVYPAEQILGMKRSHERWVDSVEDLESQKEAGATHDNVRGIMGRSPLLKLNNFDIVQQSPPDPLHRDWLGVMKFNLWRNTVGMSKSGVANAKGQRISKAISDSYQMIRLPTEFSHTARPMDYPNFKGHEWKSLLVSSFPTIIDEVNQELGSKCAHIWTLFAFLILLYNGDDETFQAMDEEVLEDMHQLFYDEFQEEFGPSLCSFNLHSFYHMPTVRKWGRPTQLSTESFESSYGLVQISYAPGTRNTGLQIIRNMTMRSLAHTRDKCQRKLFIAKDNGKRKRDDSLLMGRNHKYYKVQDIRRNGDIAVSEIQKSVWRCPADPTLPFDMVGVYTYDGISEDVLDLPVSHFQGKCILRNDGVLVPCHKELLFS